MDDARGLKGLRSEHNYLELKDEPQYCGSRWLVHPVLWLIFVYLNCTDSSVAKDRLSGAGGPRFESQTGWLTGKSIPSLWRDKHLAIKGLQPPELHARQIHPDRKRLLRVKTNNDNNSNCDDIEHKETAMERSTRYWHYYYYCYYYCYYYYYHVLVFIITISNY